MTPRMRLASVTPSGETLVGASAVAMRQPAGRKNRRSAHSSTTGPLLAYTNAGRFQRLLVGDDERRVDADLGIVDHRDHAAREQRVENPAGRFLVEQRARSGYDEVHAEHEPAPAHVADDRDLILPGAHLLQHQRTEAAAVIDQLFLDDRADGD